MLSRVVVAIALAATPMAPVAMAARAPNFTATWQPAGGLAGSDVQVTFSYTPPPSPSPSPSLPPVINYRAAPTAIPIKRCTYFLDADEKSAVECRRTARAGTWTMAMPISLTTGKHAVHWTIDYPFDEPTKSGQDKGEFPFEVVAPAFTTTVEPSAANPGQPVDVRFAVDLRNVTITGCSVQGVRCGEDRRGWFARVPAPDATSPVPWTVHYTGGPGTDNHASSDVTINVEPWPAPQFQVAIAGSTQVEPGTPVTVKFDSLTAGVHVKTCWVTYRGERIDCAGAHLATVMIRGNADIGPDDLPWKLTYESSRQGEPGGRRNGSVGFTVTVMPPDFAVTVQPPAARPGDTVTVALTPLVPGVEIADCIVFFPHANGNTCRRSPQPRIVRTRVPTDLPPGAVLLRWAVSSIDAAGRKGADDDAIAYPILPPLPRTGASTRTTTPATKRTTPTTRATTPAVGGPTGTEQAATLPGTPPEFVAETRPESAPPGARVTVVVSPLDPDVRIVGCAVVFSGGGDRVCRHSGGRWSAQATVPAGAPAGDTLPLDWRVSFVNTAGAGDDANGTTDYPVRGSTLPAPAFEVVAVPVAATGGKEVVVTHNSADAGVTITGCRVGFTDEDLTDCAQSPGGWTARVKVPGAMAAGANPLHWTIGYARSGGPGGTAHGFSTFEVLPANDTRGWPYTIWNLFWRTALGGVLLVGLLAFRVIRKPILDRFRPRPAAAQPDDRPPSDDDDQQKAETVTVVPVPAPEEMSVRVDRPDAPPARDIRFRIRRPRLTPDVPEDLP